MNNIFKSLGFSLVLFASMSLFMPAYAAENAMVGNASTAAVQMPSNMYTWEQIADKAIVKNVDFKTTEVDKMKMGRQTDDLINNVNTLQTMGYLSRVDQKDKTDPLIDNVTLLRNNWESISDNVALKKEVLRDTIKNLYITIYKYEIQLSSLDEQVKLNNRLLEVDQKKVKLGLMSKYDLEKNYNGYQKIERTRNSLKINIDKLYVNLKDLAGLNPKEFIILDYTFIKNEPILPIDYQSGFAKMSQGNMKIDMYIKAADRANQFKIGVQNRYPKGDTNFVMADLDSDKAQLTLDNARAALPYKYDSAFNTVMDAYDSYNQKQREYDVKKLDMKNTVLKLKLGSASKLEQTVMDTQMKAIENELLSSRLEYVSAKVALESTVKGTN